MNVSVGIRRTDYFLLKNILLGVAAASIAFATSFTGNYELNNLLNAAALGGITFFAYQLASWHPVVSGKWLTFNRKPGLITSILTVSAGLAGMLYLSSRLSLLIIPGVITVLYYLRWPYGFLKGGMRSFFLVKNILVGVIWTFITYNIMVVPDQPDTIAWAGRFLLVMILTFGLDLRDIESDLQRKVRTIPVHFGFRRAKQAILAFTVMVAAILALLDFPFRNATLLSLVLAAMVISILKPHTGYWTYFLLLDGILPLHALFILVLR